MAQEVTLGGVVVEVIPQRHAYLTHRLGPAFMEAFGRGNDITPGALFDWAGEGTYDVLAALIPTLPRAIPKHVFMGLPDEDAEFDEKVAALLEGCPTIPEIITAFRVAMQVNGINDLVSLGKGMFDPRWLRARIQLALADHFDSPSLPIERGESPSTSSLTTPPNSNESGESPSSVSAA